GDGLPGRRPLGFVVRDGGEHVLVDHEAVAGQAPAQRLDEGGGGDHDSASAIRSAVARAPVMLMIEAAWSTPGTGRTVTSTSSASRKARTASAGWAGAVPGPVLHSAVRDRTGTWSCRHFDGPEEMSAAWAIRASASRLPGGPDG